MTVSLTLLGLTSKFLLDLFNEMAEDSTQLIDLQSKIVDAEIELMGARKDFLAEFEKIKELYPKLRETARKEKERESEREKKEKEERSEKKKIFEKEEFKLRQMKMLLHKLLFCLPRTNYDEETREKVMRMFMRAGYTTDILREEYYDDE